MTRRTVPLAAVALPLALVAGCTRPQPSPSLLGRPEARVAGTFTAIADPLRGTLTVQPDPAPASALTAWGPYQDGIPGSGPADTFELVTEQQAPYPGVEAGGCGGGVDAYRAEVTLRSFFRTQTLRNVLMEVTEVTGGFEGCAGAPAVPGVSAAFGLWAYPDVPPGAARTATWRFRCQASQPFTFRGRIMADLDVPVPAAGAPELDWSPGALEAQRSFRRVATTRAHLVWNGATFVNDLGGITFAAHGAPGSTFSAIPGAAYANGTGYFVATAATGGDPLDLSGDFTACVKFKPGALPAWGTKKALLAKGEPESPDGGVTPTEGWALVLAPGAYAFVYRTALDDAQGRGEVIVRSWENGWSPQAAAYDYLCAGRSGSNLHLMAHGATEELAWPESEAGTFAGHGATLPLAIGAYPDGSSPASDAGVYEVILDARAASPEVMKELVDAAEARNVPGSRASYVPPSSAPTTRVGADGLAYGLPPYATPPLSYDRTGLLGAGEVVSYLHPLAENTNLSGYCAGAEVVATGDWASVAGGVLGVDNGWGTWDWTGMWLSLNPLRLHDAQGDVTAASWPAGSGGAHVFVACVATSGVVTLYVDGVPVGATGSLAGQGIVDLSTSNPPRKLHIGEGGGTALTGARIRRVFLCPSPVLADCHP